MTAYTYTSYVSALASEMVVPTSDPNFQTILPTIITNAELRLQRDLDLVDSTVRDSSFTFTLNTRNFTLPTAQGTFIVVDQLNVITPAGTTDPEQGTRNSLIPTSIDMLDFLWPSSSGSTLPVYMSMMNQDMAIVGPFPDQQYTVEVVGSVRFPSLSSAVATNPLSVFFPDLYLSASMVEAAAYQRNFGAMSDDPKMGINWEAHYQAQLKSAQTEEAKKKFLIGKNAAAGG
jgi:hypothetical protein